MVDTNTGAGAGAGAGAGYQKNWNDRSMPSWQLDVSRGHRPAAAQVRRINNAPAWLRPRTMICRAHLFSRTEDYLLNPIACKRNDRRRRHVEGGEDRSLRAMVGGASTSVCISHRCGSR